MKAFIRQAVTVVFWSLLFRWLWNPVLRWVFLFMAIVFVVGMCQGRAKVYEGHGAVDRMSRDEIARNLSIRSSVLSNQVNVEITNSGKSPAGNFVIGCDDGDGRTFDVNVTDSAKPTETVTYSYSSVDVSYSTQCEIKSANRYEK